MRAAALQGRPDWYRGSRRPVVCNAHDGIGDVALRSAALLGEASAVRSLAMAHRRHASAPQDRCSRAFLRSRHLLGPRHVGCMVRPLEGSS
jgi:hypothetical protein